MSKDYKSRLIIGFCINDPYDFMKKFMKVTDPVFETHAQFCPKTGAKLPDAIICSAPIKKYWDLSGTREHVHDTLDGALESLLQIVRARGDVSNGVLYIYSSEMSGDDCSVSCNDALVLMEEAKMIGQSLKDMGLEPGEPCVRAILDTW